VADLIVVEELKAYLVAQGLAVHPGPSLSLPSVWTPPRDGAMHPRDGENATIVLAESLNAPAGTLEAWITESFVNVIVRAREDRDAKLIQRSILDLIHPNAAHGGRFVWTMNNLVVEYSRVWRGDQALEADKVSYTRVQSFVFGCRRKALAGTPLVP
jgi:hypothetical protein